MNTIIDVEGGLEVPCDARVRLRRIRPRTVSMRKSWLTWWLRVLPQQKCETRAGEIRFKLMIVVVGVGTRSGVASVFMR